MIDAAYGQRKDEDFKVKLGMILGAHFEKVEVADYLTVHDKGSSAVIDPLSRVVVKCDREDMQAHIELVISNM